MQSRTARRLEGRNAILRLECRSDRREEIPAEWVVPLGIGVAAGRPNAGCGVADNERRLAIQQVIDADAKLQLLSKPENRGDVQIVLRAELRVRRTDIVRQAEPWIECSEFQAAHVPPLKRQGNSVRRVPCSPSGMFPARLNAARRSEQAGTIVRRGEAAIVDDPMQDVAAAEFDACRAEPTKARGIIRGAVDPASPDAADEPVFRQK